jgi:hypothetical protein
MIYQGTAYSYNQRAEILVPLRKGTSYFIPQNTTPLVVYKGLDTDIEFFIKDANRKPLNIVNKTFVARVIDRENNTVRINETLVPVDYTTGSTVMRISQDDTSNLDAGLYDLIITYTDSESKTFGLSSDKNNRMTFVFELKESPLTSPRNSVTLNTFTLINSSYYTSRTPGTSQSFNRDGTNTCAVYLTNYTGVFYAQGTLESNPTESNWFTIQLDPENAEDGYEFTSETDVIPFTWDGMFVWVRFYHVPDGANVGTLDKVLYRN